MVFIQPCEKYAQGECDAAVPDSPSLIRTVECAVPEEAESGIFRDMHRLPNAFVQAVQITGAEMGNSQCRIGRI